ncbi:Smr/MutS family protein [Paludibacterium paludis]|uniref:Smr domain-containing protein n=1 Tax=Paludibacterium paludis TaxID=1225769 RepID=A0A918UAW1_9NEIS|nr:Smr/MutS family protein [Paludibacterium paludis]GGY19151.1 hypothetical protein GCM10011289_23270 [Paludibacterium paludis]
MKDFKSALKAVKPRIRPDEPAAPAPRPAPEPDFPALFADAVPLKDDGRYHAPPRHPSPRPRTRGQQEAQMTPALELELMRQLVGWFEPREADRQFVRGGVNSGILKRLRGNHWPCSGQLDLHGCDRFQAQEVLTVFLHRARRRGNCVRIIHGKGFGSGGEPVLKPVVRAWLRHHPDVLAFCEADDSAGGSGALLVLLKRMTPSESGAEGLDPTRY